MAGSASEPTRDSAWRRYRSGARRVSFLRGASHPHEAGSRRVGGGWFWAGDFTVNVSKPISPRARRPIHRAHRADKGFGWNLGSKLGALGANRAMRASLHIDGWKTAAPLRELGDFGAGATGGGPGRRPGPRGLIPDIGGGAQALTQPETPDGRAKGGDVHDQSERRLGGEGGARLRANGVVGRRSFAGEGPR